jgi:hypothetical protein
MRPASAARRKDPASVELPGDRVALGQRRPHNTTEPITWRHASWSNKASCGKWRRKPTRRRRGKERRPNQRSTGQLSRSGPHFPHSGKKLAGEINPFGSVAPRVLGWAPLLRPVWPSSWTPSTGSVRTGGGDQCGTTCSGLGADCVGLGDDGCHRRRDLLFSDCAPARKPGRITGRAVVSRGKPLVRYLRASAHDLSCAPRVAAR